MSRYNRKCILCGKEYKYCSDCREEQHQPSWKNTYCSENCRTIFNTVVAYAQKTISHEDAQKMLNACDLTNKEKIRIDFIKLIDEIMKTEEKIEIKEEKVDEPKVEKPAEQLKRKTGRKRN